MIPYLLAVVALLAARTLVVGPVPLTELPPTTLAFTSAVILLRYLRIALWPDAPVTLYPLELHTTLGLEGWGGVAAALVAVGLVLWLWRRRERLLLFWFLFFFLWLALSFNVGRFGHFMMMEKMLYVPSLGLSALVALALARLAGERIAAALLMAVVLAYGGNTWQRVPHWSDTIAMVSEGLRHAPRFTLAWYSLGMERAERGEYPAALYAFERVVELEPGDSLAHNNLGNIHFLAGRHSDALAAWRRAIEGDRRNPQPYFNIAMTLE